MSINPEDRYESIEILLTEEKYPIAFRNKLAELMGQKAFETEEEAKRWIQSTPITLEIYYEKDAGLFAVESDALESCPKSIRSPYSGEPFTEGGDEENKTFRLSGIEYDTDNEAVELPREMTVEAFDEDDAVNIVSEKTGWLISSVERIERIK